jgi:hypothetical protein
MASNREMRAIGRDPARARSLTLGLLKLAETAEYTFTDWELTFLRSLVGLAETTVGLTKKQQKDAGVAARVSPVDPLLHRSFMGMAAALIELGRFDKAIVAAKKALRQNSSYTGVSRPRSSISDATPRRVRQRRMCLSTIPPLQYLPGSLAAGNQTRSYIPRGFGRRGCPNEPRCAVLTRRMTSTRPRHWRARSPAPRIGGADALVVLSNPLNLANRARIAELAASSKLTAARQTQTAA